MPCYPVRMDIWRRWVELAHGGLVIRERLGLARDAAVWNHWAAEWDMVARPGAPFNLAP
jgi:hypothetical protein